MASVIKPNVMRRYLLCLRDRSQRTKITPHPQGRGLAPIDLFCSASNAAAFRSARLIQADLHEVGIEVRVREVPWGELSERVDQQVAPLFLLSWVADLADPDAFMRTLFESEGSSNFFDFNDPEAGSLLTEGALETNPVKRADIYRRCETRTLKLAPLVPLYYPISYLAVRSRVRGLEPGPLGLSNVKLGKVWLAARSGSPS